MSKHLRVGSLVAHYPAGDAKLAALAKEGVIPELTPDFRIGLILQEKPGHLLILCNESTLPCWYTHEELQLLS